MQVIVYMNDNGFASIIYPVSDKNIHDIAIKAVPEGKEYFLVNKSKIPLDREYRNAIIIDEGEIRHSMQLARKIHMDKIREKRNKMLFDSDTDLIKAMEKGDTAEQQKLAAARQKLRDIPQTFDLSKARTTDELKKLWPDDLS